MAERTPISMSALTAGLESARARGTASGRENLMEGRTYIPRMSKEQKALLISALQASAKKRAPKVAERKKEREEKRLNREASKLKASDYDTTLVNFALSNDILDPTRTPETGSSKVVDDAPTASSSTQNTNQINADADAAARDIEAFHDAMEDYGGGGVIQKPKKKRTIKYRK